jgi:hypothetical protein
MHKYYYYHEISKQVYIIALILKTASDGNVVTETKIMYSVFLSFTQFIFYSVERISVASHAKWLDKGVSGRRRRMRARNLLL